MKLNVILFKIIQICWNMNTHDDWLDNSITFNDKWKCVKLMRKHQTECHRICNVFRYTENCHVIQKRINKIITINKYQIFNYVGEFNILYDKNIYL